LSTEAAHCNSIILRLKSHQCCKVSKTWTEATAWCTEKILESSTAGEGLFIRKGTSDSTSQTDVILVEHSLEVCRVTFTKCGYLNSNHRSHNASIKNTISAQHTRFLLVSFSASEPSLSRSNRRYSIPLFGLCFTISWYSKHPFIEYSAVKTFFAVKSILHSLTPDEYLFQASRRIRSLTKHKKFTVQVQSLIEWSRAHSTYRDLSCSILFATLEFKRLVGRIYTPRPQQGIDIHYFAWRLSSWIKFKMKAAF
jgi:hypothetical protein